MVSFGTINLNGRIKLTEKRLSDIENLLIYSHSSIDFPRLVNKKNVRTHKVAPNYYLKNSGFCDDGRYPEVASAVFYKSKKRE